VCAEAFLGDYVFSKFIAAVVPLVHIDKNILLRKNDNNVERLDAGDKINTYFKIGYWQAKVVE